jgi:hypothetical protein
MCICSVLGDFTFFTAYLLKRKNYAGSEKPLPGVPTINKEKEPLWYRVPTIKIKMFAFNGEWT